MTYEKEQYKEKKSMPYMYILQCADDSYYTGSTWDLDRRLEEHKAGEGAYHTSKKLPVELVYYEEYDRIDDAFYREKQIQKWVRKKKIALVEGRLHDLPKLAKKIFSKKVTFDTPRKDVATQ